MPETTAEIKRKVGRPKKQMSDVEGIIYKLSKLHCTVSEISAVTGVARKILNTDYAELVDRGREDGKQTLRRYQWEQAEKGNVSMLIWLGKQVLQQRDKQPDEAAQVNYNVFCNEVPIASGLIEVKPASINTEPKGP